MDQMVEGQDLPYDLGDCLRCDAGGRIVCQPPGLGLDLILHSSFAGRIPDQEDCDQEDRRGE